MSTNRLQELTALIYQWGIDRKLHANSTPQAQARKAFEEWIELLRDVERLNKEGRTEDVLKALRDDFGDIFVCVVQIAGSGGMRLETIWCGEEDADGVLGEGFNGGFGLIPASLFGLWSNHRDGHTAFFSSYINEAIDTLKAAAGEFELDFTECVAAAWDDIKDRKGYLREDGIFVKETA